MLDIPFIASVAERDIDLVVLEELSVSDEFRDWFSSRVYGAPVYQAEIGAWHSVVSGALGESDVLFVFTSQLGQRIALLIENKISAPPQREQGDRYKQRGQKGIRDGFWDEFKTCVMAPDRYLASSKHTESYDAEVAYEELLAFFSSRRFRDARYLYKAKIVQEAIEQNRRGYQPDICEAMTYFIEQCHAIAVERFPHLGVQDAKPRPSGSTWMMFSPLGLPKQISLCHQLTAGAAKLFFNSSMGDIDLIRARYSFLPTGEIKIDQASKSIAVWAHVPKVAPLLNSFEQERDKVIEALEVVAKLYEVVRRVEGI